MRRYHVDRRNRWAAWAVLVSVVVMILLAALVIGWALVGLASWANATAPVAPAATVTRASIAPPARVTTYNTLFTRPARAVHADLVRLAPRSDVMLLQETRRPAWVLRTPGFRVLRWSGPAGGVPITYRASRFVLVGAGHALSMYHPFRWDTTWARLRDRVTGRSMVVVNFHGASRVEVRGHPRRSTRARVNYPNSMARLAALVERRTGPLIVGGDWNVNRWTDRRVRWHGFPAAMARRTGLHAADRFRSRGTLGRRTIDYTLARGLTPVSLRVWSGYGSDHRPVTVAYR